MASNSVILVVLFFASIIYLTHSSVICDLLEKCSEEFAYAVVVGAVSLLVSGVLMLGTILSNLPEISHTVGSLFMLVWWAAGCGVGTFRGPFVIPCNGYFSVWIAFIASAIYAVNNVEFLKKEADSYKGLSSISYCRLILFYSNVMFLEASISVCRGGNCTNYEAYAVSVGVIGLLICIIFYEQSVLNNLSGLGKFLAGFNALWWGLGAAITTFKEPFVIVGNGYFSAWISFFTAGFLFCLMAPEVAEKFGVEYKAADKEAEQQTNDATLGDV